MALYAAGYHPLGWSGGLESLRRTEARGASANSIRPVRASISWQSGLLLQWLLSQPPSQKRLRDHRQHNNCFGPPAPSSLGGASLESNGLWPSWQAKQNRIAQKSRRSQTQIIVLALHGHISWVPRARVIPAYGEGAVPLRRKGARRRGHLAHQSHHLWC
jgi:hypothetical protein